MTAHGGRADAITQKTPDGRASHEPNNQLLMVMITLARPSVAEVAPGGRQGVGDDIDRRRWDNEKATETLMASPSCYRCNDKCHRRSKDDDNGRWGTAMESLAICDDYNYDCSSRGRSSCQADDTARMSARPPAAEAAVEAAPGGGQGVDDGVDRCRRDDDKATQTSMASPSRSHCTNDAFAIARSGHRAGGKKVIAIKYQIQQGGGYHRGKVDCGNNFDEHWEYSVCYCGDDTTTMMDATNNDCVIAMLHCPCRRANSDIIVLCRNEVERSIE